MTLRYHDIRKHWINVRLFAKHINDVITLPASLPFYTPTPHYQKISCREEMENLPDGVCMSNLPNIAKAFSSICNDPRYTDWFVHYWKTKDAIILRVLSNTSWSGSYGDSSGSSSVDGQGSKNITMLCPGGDSYSATFSKKDSSEDKSLTLNVIQNAIGRTSILDPYTHAPTPYPIIAHPVVVSSHTTNAAYGMVSDSGGC